MTGVGAFVGGPVPSIQPWSEGAGAVRARQLSPSFEGVADAADAHGFGDTAGEVFDVLPVELGEVTDDVFGVRVVLPGPVAHAASASASARMRPSSAEAARRASLS
jgi:hypothetical protein